MKEQSTEVSASEAPSGKYWREFDGDSATWLDEANRNLVSHSLLMKLSVKYKQRKQKQMILKVGGAENSFRPVFVVVSGNCFKVQSSFQSFFLFPSPSYARYQVITLRPKPSWRNSKATKHFRSAHRSWLMKSNSETSFRPQLSRK